MFLTVLSAIALAAGGSMTVNSLSAEDGAATDVREPVVDVAPIQQQDQVPGELGW